MNEPLFHVVIDFDLVREEFAVVGVFTKQEDADEFAAKARSQQEPKPFEDKFPYTLPDPQPFAWIAEQMMQHRFGEMKDILLRIEERIKQ